jgi:hypothetical protein
MMHAPPSSPKQTPRRDKTNGIFHEEDFPGLMNSIHTPPKQTNNQKQKENEKDKAKLNNNNSPTPKPQIPTKVQNTNVKVNDQTGRQGIMWNVIVKSNYMRGPETQDGKAGFTQEGTRAKDRKTNRNITTQNNPLTPVKETKYPRDRQVIMERDSKTNKPDANMDKIMMDTINKHLTDHNVPEHIRIDLARVTTNGN